MPSKYKEKLYIQCPGGNHIELPDLDTYYKIEKILNDKGFMVQVKDYIPNKNKEGAYINIITLRKII